MKRHVFIIGSKGIPAKYGGFETFVDELVSRQVNKDIKYHVACLNDPDHKYHKADCFGVSVPNVGPAKAVLYDIKAMKYVIKYAKENNIRDGIVYVLACRIGPFFGKYVKKLHKLGFRVYVNPDGHEWLRAKWNAAIKKYWKLSEKLMVKHADLLICDSKNIENYIKEDYAKYNPATTFIPYGADTTKSQLKDNSKELRDFYDKHNLAKNGYYLMVGRFVPENNYEIVIREFMKSNAKRDLVIISNVEKNKFYNELLGKTGFDKDARIKFVGTIYGKQLLKKIRENSYAYIHGHSVGGTNPSLLEALASTKLNILYDCGFNREVAEDGAVYFGEGDDLNEVISAVENLNDSKILKLTNVAKKRINNGYDWSGVVDVYEKQFHDEPLVSIIVPIYNVEKYLDECLKSIKNQSYKNIEVLLINDGSIDDSANICKKYAAKDRRFRLYNKKNGGLSDARNYGLDRMHGEYVCFVDGDDIIHPEFVFVLLNAAQKSNALISSCKLAPFTKLPKSAQRHHKQYPGHHNVANLLYLCKTYRQLKQKIYSVSVCNKIFAATIFDNIRFKTGILYEDIEIMDRLILQTDEISIINMPLYYYRRNNCNSITSKSYNNRNDDVIKNCDHLIKKYRSNIEIYRSLKIMKYTKEVELLTKQFASAGKISKTNDYFSYIKSHRLDVLCSSGVRSAIRISAIVSFFGPSLMAKINLMRKKATR